MRRTISFLPILMLALLTPFAVAASEPERAPAWALKQHHVTSASPMSGLFSPSVWDSDGWPGGKAEIVGGGKLVRLQTVVDAPSHPGHTQRDVFEPRDGPLSTVSA